MCNPNYLTFFEVNKARWNELVAHHVKSDFYDLHGFLNGKNTLTNIETKEIGNLLHGKLVLHLQCHFGLDTFSLERFGASNVIGIDFSEKAIEFALQIKKQIKSNADFICANIYDLPQILSARDQFDIVFTSYGVLCWLPDLKEWAKIISLFLKKHGFFYIVEDHPFATIFENDPNSPELKVQYPYFQSNEPLQLENDFSYATDVKLENKITYEWNHPLSNIFNVLMEAGLTIEFFHEFPFSSWKRFPFMEKNHDGFWRLTNSPYSIPLTFSLKTHKK